MCFSLIVFESTNTWPVWDPKQLWNRKTPQIKTQLNTELLWASRWSVCVWTGGSSERHLTRVQQLLPIRITQKYRGGRAGKIIADPGLHSWDKVVGVFFIGTLKLCYIKKIGLKPDLVFATFCCALSPLAGFSHHSHVYCMQLWLIMFNPFMLKRA